MLGEVGVPVGQKRRDFYFPREEKMMNPTSKKHHIVFGSLEIQLPASLGSRGNQWAPAASWSRTTAGNSPLTSSSWVVGNSQVLNAKTKELWTLVLTQTNSQDAGQSLGKVCKYLDNLETWGFASQPGEEVVSRLAGWRPESWGW